jgi:hypothetical protein
MQVKTITVEIPEKSLPIIQAISQLFNEGKEINPFAVTKLTKYSWEYVKKQMKNNFNIKEK